MIHVVTGQTATGKTSYALKLAKELGGELINADARQLYKELDIVTGKDLHRASGSFQKVKELNGSDIGYYLPEGGSRLWLYDVVAPNQPFSTYEYKTCAQWVIDDIESRGRVPIIVGGSYFYIQHLLYDVIDNKVPPNNKLRQELGDAPVSELQDKLKELNASVFEELNKSEQHNPQRLIRRIEKEMYKLKHPPQSPLPPSLKTSEGHGKGGTNGLPFRDVLYHITGFRFNSIDDLTKTISERVEKRLDAGGIDETVRLRDKGYTVNDPGLKTIGYVQIIQYLNKEISLEEMKTIWISKEVQYAKRQLTFMKKNNEIEWISISCHNG